MKILSIDDSAVVRKIIRAAADVLQLEFVGAESGTEAMELLREHHETIDLILLDWNMPGLDGMDVLQLLKQDSEFARIPVMMVTTESENSKVVEAIKAGAINYMTKPFTMEELITKIMECMGEA